MERQKVYDVNPWRTEFERERQFASLFITDDNHATPTSIEQRRIERSLLEFLDAPLLNPLFRKYTRLARDAHADYLLKGYSRLSKHYSSLDASRPWLCYWLLNSLDLLQELRPKIIPRAVDFLGRCQDPRGGFAGGPGQLPHLAPTYASVNALVILGTEEAYKVINRERMLQFLLRMKQPDGSFIMHESGESDVRGTYCAMVVASLLNILTPELVANVPEYIAKCQTYEGGVGGCPGNEAHGGYTYCAVSALTILNRIDVLDRESLLRWAVERQMPFAGGFQGRTNKLVDSCYSFWMGAIFPQLGVTWKDHYRPPVQHNEEEKETDKSSTKTPSARTYTYGEEGPLIGEADDEDPSEYVAIEEANIGFWLFDQRADQIYLIFCAQEFQGGMRDKPGKSRDFYHTCYALSGLSIAQNNGDATTTVVGPSKNRLQPMRVEYGVTAAKVAKALAYFNELPSPTQAVADP